MKAGEVMTPGAATVRPDATLAEAARIMLEHRISGLPVVDADGTLVGIITERDFLRCEDGERPRWIDILLSARARITASELHRRRVAEVMSKEPIFIGVEAPVEDIVELMERYVVKRLPVVANGRVVGIVSRANLLLALARKADSISDSGGSSRKA
jgi:CBS domain-containing protein